VKINSHNEWDRLREVIVGTMGHRAGVVFPRPGQITEELLDKVDKLSREAYPAWLVDEINEDQEELCAALRKFDVTVHRADPSDINKLYATPHWSAAGDIACNTRDLHLVVGNTVIESPSQERHRLYEATVLYEIWQKHFEAGFRWIAAPKPRLVGDYAIGYYEDGKKYVKLAETEILFEAANTVRMGRDLLYLVSRSGNYLGAKWLQSILGDEYRVHTTDEIYRSSHIDSTVLCLRAGLVLLNASRVNPKNCPKVLDKWEKVYFKDIVPTPKATLDFQENVRLKIHHQLAELGVESSLDYLCSDWIGMNFLSVDPEHVILDKRQEPLMRVLEKHKITPVPISFRHGYVTGGIHCNTLDIVRDSKLESYG